MDENELDIEDATTRLYEHVLKTSELGSQERKTAERYFSRQESLKHPLKQLDGQKTYLVDGVECWDSNDYPERLRTANLNLREAMDKIGVHMNEPPETNSKWIPVVEIHREDSLPFHSYLYYNGDEKIPKKNRKDYFGKSASLHSAYSY